MTSYLYKNEKTEEIIEREFSMQGEIPAKVEEKRKVYIRYYGNSLAIKIPYQWGHETNIKTGKTASGRKHFF